MKVGMSVLTIRPQNCKTIVLLIIPTYVSVCQLWKFGDDQSRTFQDNWWDMPILPNTSSQVLRWASWYSKLVKFQHDVVGSSPILMRASALRSSNPLRNASATNDGGWPNFADLPQNRLSWQLNALVKLLSPCWPGGPWKGLMLIGNQQVVILQYGLNCFQESDRYWQRVFKLITTALL